MAKPPLGAIVDPTLADRVEAWLDSRIRENSKEFSVFVSQILLAFPTMEDNKSAWEELKRRYEAAGWATVDTSYWTDKENGSGPYFYLSK